MAGVGRSVRRIGVAGILAALLVPAAPAPLSAASDGQILTRHALSSVAADLDGDGAREVVAVVAEPEDGAVLRVAAWGVVSGEWLSLGEERIQRWIAADETAIPAILGAASASLLTIRDGDRTRVVVAAAAPYDNDGSVPGACCLSFSKVTLSAGGGLRVELMPDDLGSVDSITMVDIDADRRDELLVSTYAGDESDPWRPMYTLLRQEGGGFHAEPLAVPDGEQIHFSGAGATDARPGDDLLFMTRDNRAIVRMTSDGDGLATERVSAAGIVNRSGGGWIAGAMDGVVVFVSERGVTAARWPRGGPIESIASARADPWPSVYVAGEGSGARLIEVTGMDHGVGADLRLRVLDLDLTVELEAEASPETIDLWEFTQGQGFDPTPPITNLYPQIGPLPGGLPDGSAAFLGLGSFIALDPDGAHTVEPAASLVGGELLGLVGAASEWVAIGSSWFGTGRWAYLGAIGADPASMPESRLAVARLDAVLRPPAALDAGVTLANATLVDLPEGPMLFAGEDGFQATVRGDRGTVVFSTVGASSTVDEIPDGPLTVDIDVHSRSTPDRQHDARILLVSPAGIARSVRWNLTILPDVPEVAAEASFELFEGHASVFGEVSPATTVTVDGRPVDSFGDGAFRTDVSASIWPRDVVVVVRDPIGHETIRQVEVVGIVDVRALPWIPMMAVLTVAAGIVLFLRTPEVRPEPRLAIDGDAHLEEIDGDLV